MGKTKISAMFTSNVFKNRDSVGKVKSFDCDNIVDDVIAEFAPDEADRERRRRGQLIVKNATPIKSENRFFDNGNDVNFMVKADLDRDFINFKSGVDEKKEGIVEVKEKGEDKLSNLVKEEVVSVLEVKADEAVVKKDGGRTLNAKISDEERDPALSATAGWKEVMNGKNGGEAVGGAGVVEEVKSGANCEEQSEFELDGDGSLPFYILDAHEEIFGANTGTIYLFGKVMLLV
jgi:DNA polymerase alpha subunit A